MAGDLDLVLSWCQVDPEPPTLVYGVDVLGALDRDAGARHGLLVYVQNDSMHASTGLYGTRGNRAWFKTGL